MSPLHERLEPYRAGCTTLSDPVCPRKGSSWHASSVAVLPLPPARQPRFYAEDLRRGHPLHPPTARFLSLKVLASRNFFGKATFALDNQLQPVQHVRVWPGRGGRAMRSPRLLLRLPLPPSTACSAILVSFLNTSRAEADDAKRLKLCYRNRGLLLLHIEAPSGHGLNLPFLLGV